ncbi:AI-2E family transporter [Bradyrhizobium sp. ARR65]|uniref:AI-2E family transporter n=1 Tax=Bradyrhizobium sp. ARR65 TaxID=1040989 RepID=UPI0004676980|nr:AI-2E family transporter [Bradyrhizobium sp. ARR65]
MSDQPDSGGQERDHEHVARISTPTILFVVAATVLAVYELQLVLMPFVLAGVVSYICTPAIDKISQKARLPRLLVSILGFLLILALLAAIAFLGVPPLVEEIKRISTDFEGTVNGLAQGAIGAGKINLLGQEMDAQSLAKALAGAIRESFGNMRVLTLLGGSAVVSGFGFLLTLLLLFFFMVSGHSIVRGLLWLIPPGERPLIRDHILSNLDPVLRRYFIGVLGVVAFAGAFAYVGLGVVLGIPHALFLALVTGILEAIPIVGPIAAATMAGLVALQHNSGLAAILGYAIYIAALRLSIDQLFGPIVLGAAGRVHPVLIIFCFLAGGSLFGVIGVILAVPVALIVRATLAVLYDEPADGAIDGKR